MRMVESAKGKKTHNRVRFHPPYDSSLPMETVPERGEGSASSVTPPRKQSTTERVINRPTCLKRQMYGRVKLDLLRQRCLAG